MRTMNTVKKYEDCIKCGNKLDMTKYWWDEGGYGYAAKICRCPWCGTVQYLEVIEDICLDVNNDERYYEYERMM